MRYSPRRDARERLLTTFLATLLIAPGCNDQYADVGKIDLTASKQKAAEIGVEKGASKDAAPTKGGRGIQPAEKPDRSKGR